MNEIERLREMTNVLDESNVSIEIDSRECITNGAKNGFNLDSIKEFNEWLEGKRESRSPFNPEHCYSRKKADENYARAQDCERYFIRNFDKYTTVHIVRTSNNDLPLLEQSASLNPKVYYQSRYRLLKRLSEDYAAISALAPRYNNYEKAVRSHVHEGYWLPGFHEAPDFELLREKHNECIPGETEFSISVQHHDSRECITNGAKNGLDNSRESTSALPNEIGGRNQPLIAVDIDALELHDIRARYWLSTLSRGSDGRHETSGMQYWTELGNFSKYADSIETSLKRQVYRDLKRSTLPGDGYHE